MRISVLHLALLGAALAVPLPSLDGSIKAAESTEIIARSPMAVAARNAILVPADNDSLSVREADDDEEGDLAKRSPSPEPAKKKKKTRKQKKQKKKAKAAKKKKMNQEMDNMTPEEMEAELEKLNAELPTAKGKQKKQMKSKIKMLEKKLARKGGKSKQDVLDQPGDPDGGFDNGMFDEPAGDAADPTADEPLRRRDT